MVIEFGPTIFDAAGSESLPQTSRFEWLHADSDLALFGACAAIAIAIVHFASKRRDFPFPKLLGVVGLFLLCCGMAHSPETSQGWPPQRLSGWGKLLAAAAAWASIVVLARHASQPKKRSTNEKRPRADEQGDAEDSLRFSEERFRSLAFSLNSVVWTTDASGALCDPQPAWEAFTGQTWEQYRGFGWAEMVHADDRDRVRAAWEDAVSHRHSYRVECRLWSRRHGAYRHVRANGVPIPDGRGGVREWVGTTEDVADQRFADERFQLTFESAPNGFLLLDAEGKIAMANQAAGEIFGYGREELLGAAVEQLVPERFRSGHAEYRQRYLASPTRRAMGEGRKLFGLHKNGSEVPVEIGLNPIWTSEGMVVLATIVDITERGRAERLLEEKSRDLERSNAELEQFAYMASHDLQEPLRTVSSFLHLIEERKGPELTEETREFIRYAIEGAQRMQTLIRDLLSFSRAGTREVVRAPTDLEELLDEVLLTLRTSVAASSGSVTYDALPSVEADRGQILQVLQNLIANALKFHGAEPPRVHVSAELEGADCVLSVSDNGIGFDPAHAERIFGVFQRLHTREEFEGTGIGLAICKKIVERHGGRIWVDSAPGRGSTFRFALPGTGARAGPSTK